MIGLLSVGFWSCLKNWLCHMHVQVALRSTDGEPQRQIYSPLSRKVPKGTCCWFRVLLVCPLNGLIVWCTVVLEAFWFELDQFWTLNSLCRCRSVLCRESFSGWVFYWQAYWGTSSSTEVYIWLLCLFKRGSSCSILFVLCLLNILCIVVYCIISCRRANFRHLQQKWWSCSYYPMIVMLGIF